VCPNATCTRVCFVIQLCLRAPLAQADWLATRRDVSPCGAILPSTHRLEVPKLVRKLRQAGEQSNSVTDDPHHEMEAKRVLTIVEA
jgi:hypothetical protein